jgi:hypothetical protein
MIHWFWERDIVAYFVALSVYLPGEVNEHDIQTGTAELLVKRPWLRICLTLHCDPRKLYKPRVNK